MVLVSFFLWLGHSIITETKGVFSVLMALVFSVLMALVFSVLMVVVFSVLMAMVS